MCFKIFQTATASPHQRIGEPLNVNQQLVQMHEKLPFDLRNWGRKKKTHSERVLNC